MLTQFFFLKILSEIGKTVLIKKKAQLAKEALVNQGKLDEDVYFIPLTSTDQYGKPSHPTVLFDQFSRKQMVKHNIIAKNVHDLHHEFKNSNLSFDESKDLFPTTNNYSEDGQLRKVFENAAKKSIP